METGELIWEEAKRLLARQEAALDALHTKAFALLSVSGIVAGLFAGQVLTGPMGTGRAVAVGVALTAFVISAALVLYIQWPRRFDFSHDLDDWIKELEAGQPAPMEEATYNLSRDLNRYRKTNQVKIDGLHAWFSWTSVALAVQILAWGMATTL